MQELYMPNLGMTMIEGKVGKWYAEDGSNVEEGQDIVEVYSESGKLNMTIVAPVSGVLRHQAEVDVMVAIGSVIGVIE